MRRIRLTVKLPLLVVLAVVLTGGAGSLLAISVGRSTLRAAEFQHAVNSVHAYSSAVGSYLNSARSILETTAASPAITDLASARLIDPALHGLPAGVDARKRNSAKRLLGHSKVFEYVMLLQADGSIYLLEPYDLQVKTSRHELAFMAWYKEVMSAGRTIVSDLHISPVTQRPTVAVATPVRGVGGQIIGIWAGALKLEELSQLGRGGTEHGTMQHHGYITDRRGLIIAHQAEPRYVQEQTDFSAVPSVRAVLGGQRGVAEFFNPIEHEETLGAYLPLPGIGWAVVYEEHAQAAFAPMDALTRSIALASAGLVGLLGLLSVGFVRQITGPLARLTAGAERIGAGDFSRRIEVKSGNEIGRLGDAFNRMAAELERRVAGLSALNVVGTVINETVELEQLLTRTLEEGLRLVGVEAGAVLLLDEGAGELALVAHRGLSDELVQAAQWLKLGEGLAGRAAQTGQPVVMGESAEYRGALKAFVEKDRIQSVASVPLLGRTGVIGVMNLVTRNPHYFDAAGLGLLTGLGRQIAVGIEKARLFEAVQRELTERKRAEERLKHTLADLARSNTELEQFAYIASHDLQEPLRMVSSYTQLLARRYRGKLDTDADEFIAYAVDGANRMQRMINELLAYSRLGTRGKPFEPVDCHSVLGQALANLSAAVQESNALVTNDALPTVMADDLQLVLLFQNLIGNAIKFHGQGPPRVHISARQEGTEWVLSVRDNGIGIDPQYHERIFVLFQRLHGRNDYPGTGIGLAICKRIVERHGGRIWLESEAGNGSTFYFTIPMRRGE